MITTLFLLLVTAFEAFYVCSKQQRRNIQNKWLLAIAARPTVTRFAAGVLIAIALIFFIVKLGFASGVSACIVALMGAGSMVVLLQPFNYLRGVAIAGLFALIFVLELII